MLLFAKLNHLPRETLICSGDFTVVVIGVNTFADYADFSALDSHRDMGVKHLDPASVIVTNCLFGRFGKIGVLGNKCQNNAVDTEFRIDLLLHLADRLCELRHSFQGKIMGLHRNNNGISSSKSVEGNHS